MKNVLAILWGMLFVACCFLGSAWLAGVWVHIAFWAAGTR